jgi:hypothetical protein
MSNHRSPRIQLVADQAKLDLNRIIDNPKAEAIAQEVTVDSVYNFLSPKKNMDYPLFRAIVSPYLAEIIELLFTHLYNRKPLKTDGQIDDNWAAMSELFGYARQLRREHIYRESTAARMRREFETLLKEWRYSCDK